MPSLPIKRRSVKALLGAVILALLLAAALVLSHGPRTEAMPCYMVEHFYYSDATYSEQVGYKFLTCNGVISWGYETQYKWSIQGDCCGSCCGN